MSTLTKTQLEKEREDIFAEMKKHEQSAERCRGAIAMLNILIAKIEKGMAEPEPEKPSA